MGRLFSEPRQSEHKIRHGNEEKQAMKMACLNYNIVTGDGMDSSDRILANHRRPFFFFFLGFFLSLIHICRCRRTVGC